MTAFANKDKIKDALCAFFEGRYYPPVVCILVLLGYFTGGELIFGSINVLLFSLSLLIVDNARHTLIFGATFLYQISPGHAPTVPARSEYFFEGAHPYIVAFLAVSLIGSCVFYAIRTKAYLEFRISRCPLIGYMLLLSVAFILNGLFSETSTIMDFLLGTAEAVGYFFFFAVFYFGFRGSGLKRIDSYFCYCTLWIAAVILIQMALLYMTGDVFRDDGAININAIVLGWGVSTVIGASLCVLIPILFYGAMRRRYPVVYIVMATLVLLASFFSMSRTALGVSALFFFISMVIGCFFGERKTMFQIAAIAMLLIAIVTVIGYYEDVYRLFAVYFEKGLKTTGRLELWKKCVDGFFDNPLLGKGFFGLGLGESVSHFAHNTILQMLGACGAFGLVAYLLYRIETAFMFIKNPSLFKTMLGVSAAALVVASLLDIFLFSFFSMIYHSALLALAAIMNRDEIHDISSIR